MKIFLFVLLGFLFTACDNIDYDVENTKCAELFGSDINSYDCMENVLVEEDASFCKEVYGENNQVSICIQKVALRTNNANLCEEIIESVRAGGMGAPSYSRNDCYFTLGVRNQDINICDNIDREKTKISCLKSIS